MSTNLIEAILTALIAGGACGVIVAIVLRHRAHKKRMARLAEIGKRTAMRTAMPSSHTQWPPFPVPSPRRPRPRPLVTPYKEPEQDYSTPITPVVPTYYGAPSFDPPAVAPSFQGGGGSFSGAGASGSWDSGSSSSSSSSSDSSSSSSSSDSSSSSSSSDSDSSSSGGDSS